MRFYRRVAAMGVGLIVANVAAWAWALVAFHNHPTLLATAAVAYGYGLRHAVDADHIAAIDNVTRKLVAEGQRPIGAGLFFSLGHSTVVVLASLVVAVTTSALQGRFEQFKAVGGIVGTVVSGGFLLVIGALNSVLLVELWQRLRDLRAGRGDPADHADPLGGGILARLFRPAFRLIGRSWQMYPLGLLFGLGFDTATEIGLLGIAAASATTGLSTWSILVFPALFTAAMSLVDAADGVLMVGAYGWAYIEPLRKLYYNIAITATSVAVAVAVGGIELMGLVADRLALAGGAWDWIGWLADNLGTVGVGVVGLFMAGWAASAAIWRWRGDHRSEGGSASV